MAAAERIRDLRNAAGHTDPTDEEALGLLLVEDVLWGYDVNLTATHMAASTLGMLSPTTRFHRMNIHRALLGVFDGTPYLGSLDFLSGQPRLAAWPSTTQQVEIEEEAAEPPPPMDLVIMNPPFTRDSLRHDQFSHADELAIKKREKDVLGGQHHRRDDPRHASGGASTVLVGGEAIRSAARLHSSGGAFTVLGERMLKTEAGTLALAGMDQIPIEDRTRLLSDNGPAMYPGPSETTWAWWASSTYWQRPSTLRPTASWSDITRPSSVT